MNSGQTILTIGAFMFLTTILLNFYRIVADTGQTITMGQDGILATTIATSYMEIASGLAFDEVTDTSDIALTNPLALTDPALLRAEAGEDSLALFNDFDDFNGRIFDRQATGTNRIYRTVFRVSYVDPDDVSSKSPVRTCVKRLDLRTWRVFPPAESSVDVDTVQTSLVIGYFHFD